MKLIIDVPKSKVITAAGLVSNASEEDLNTLINTDEKQVVEVSNETVQMLDEDKSFYLLLGIIAAYTLCGKKENKDINL